MLGSSDGRTRSLVSDIEGQGWDFNFSRHPYHEVERPSGPHYTIYNRRHMACKLDSQTVEEGYLICEAVDHPNCKVLYDLYHQQIAGGNLIPLFDLCRDQIGYLQVGDNPGRKEPGTGEINYAKVFQHVHEAGYDGIVGMEHGNSIKGVEGELAVIEAYRAVDPA